MKKGWQKLLILLSAGFLPVFILESLVRMDALRALGWMLREPLPFFLTWLLFVGICCLLYVFRSHRVQMILYTILCFLCAMLGLSNHYKMAFRLEPVLITDVTQLSEAMNVMEGSGFNINIWAFVAAGVIAVLFIAAGCIFIRTKTEKTEWWKALVGLVLVIATPMLFRFQTPAGIERLDLIHQAEHKGCLYTAVAAEKLRLSSRAENYSQQSVEEAYQAIEGEKSATRAAYKPNIILVLGESFVDQPTLSRYVDFTDTLMPFYQELMPRCITGTINVPKVGGGTSETEFEVLTGICSRYSCNPYTMGLPPVNSVASILRGKGYRASAIHWHEGVYYNRFRNHAQLGFNSLMTTDTSNRHFTIRGTYVSDQDHFDSALAQMSRTDERDFIFLITMQNHGGYTYSDFRKKYGADTPFSNSFSATAELNLANYCYLLRETDKALENWITQLEEYPEPVVVVYFSDHLPPFGRDVYEELGIPLSGDEVHRVPYFIWSNQDDLAGNEDMYAYQLMPYVLETLGINDDPFFHHVEKLRQDGNHRDETYDLLSYDAVFGQQYAYRYAGISPKNDDFHPGGEMLLEGLAAEKFGDRIYFEPLLADPDQKYVLLVNGTECRQNYLAVSQEPVTIQCQLSVGGNLANQSQTLTYKSTSDLLAQAQPMNYHAVSVAKTTYELEKDLWTKGYRIFRSKDSFGESATLLLAGDRVIMPTAPENIDGGWQYAIDADGTLLISLPIDALNSRSGKDVQDFFKGLQAVLICFE
ncbi:MAG: hypothetical protein E7331_06120 [Clostridiales bacterium]|nr:hypothetical protein [Clostridiales bacterium]